jgi:beta-lactamase regulating signal transducer with metallopeptidase domain
VIQALLNHLWQSTLVVALAGSLALALRSNGAQVRYWLWYAASLKFLVPFSLLVALGAHFAWRPVPAAAPEALQRVVELFPAPPSAPLPLAIPSPRAPGEAGTDTLLIWIGVWACGAVGVLGWWLLRWLRVLGMVRTATPLAIDAPFPVKSSESRIEPGVVGLFRPVLLLPAGIIERLTAQQLRVIIAHELCHVRRRDNLAAATHMLVQALFWFYPLVWWLGRRLMVEREYACDESVIRDGGDREAYAEGILQVCKHYLEWPPVCVAGVAGADLKKRVELIMTPRAIARLSSTRRVLLAAAAGTTCLVPIACGLAFHSAAYADSAVQPAAAGSEPASRPRGRADLELSLSLLKHARYAELDQRMNGFQQAYELRTLDEDGLLRAFSAFEDTEPALQAGLDAWVQAFPRSYAARLARGSYYFACGVQTRGTKAYSHTTGAQWNGMEFYFDKAGEDLRDSLALDPKPLLTYNVLIRIRMQNGGQAELRALLNAALKTDPKAMSVRRAYMRSLETRWGGSLDEMLAFLDETRRAGFSGDQLWSLERLVDDERKWLARYQGGG